MHPISTWDFIYANHEADVDDIVVEAKEKMVQTPSLCAHISHNRAPTANEREVMSPDDIRPFCAR